MGNTDVSKSVAILSTSKSPYRDKLLASFEKGKVSRDEENSTSTSSAGRIMDHSPAHDTAFTSGRFDQMAGPTSADRSDVTHFSGVKDALNTKQYVLYSFSYFFVFGNCCDGSCDFTTSALV